MRSATAAGDSAIRTAGAARGASPDAAARFAAPRRSEPGSSTLPGARTARPPLGRLGVSAASGCTGPTSEAIAKHLATKRLRRHGAFRARHDVWDVVFVHEDFVI